VSTYATPAHPTAATTVPTPIVRMPMAIVRVRKNQGSAVPAINGTASAARLRGVT